MISADPLGEVGLLDHKRLRLAVVREHHSQVEFLVELARHVDEAEEAESPLASGLQILLLVSE